MKRAFSLVVASAWASAMTFGCQPAAPPKTTTSAAEAPAPEIKVTMPELAKASAAAADPRKAIADKGSVEALVAWMPNESNAVMLCGKKSAQPVDKMLAPMRGAVPTELYALVSGLGVLPTSLRNAAGDDGDGPIVVRLEDAATGKKSAILYAAKGTKGITGRKVSGLRTKDNMVLGMETWSQIAIDDSHVALVPREKVEDFVKPVVARKTGEPLALTGQKPAMTPTLLAAAWVVPTSSPTDAFTAADASLRLDEAASGELTLHVAMNAAAGERDKMNKAVRDALAKAEGPNAADYRRARVQTLEDELTFDVTFAAPPAPPPAAPAKLNAKTAKN